MVCLNYITLCFTLTKDDLDGGGFGMFVIVSTYNNFMSA